jgi:putative methionine-R-sulfoxide reductase with GAF domain
MHIKLSQTANWHTVIATQKPLAISDVRDNTDWMNRRVKINAWLRSTVKAPIRIDDEIIGVLKSDSETPDTSPRITRIGCKRCVSGSQRHSQRAAICR